MKPITPLIACTIVVFAACTSGPHRSGGAGLVRPNTQEYDTYVARRTEELAAGGKYSRSDAAALANNEATRRFGERTAADGSPQSASWSWNFGGNSRPLSLSELDKAASDAKRSK